MLLLNALIFLRGDYRASYYELCLRILSDLREAEELLSHTRRSPRGRLRVSAPTALATNFLIPALPQFFRRFPEIMLDLSSSDRPVDLIEDGFDCAIRGGELADSSLTAGRIATVHFATCAAPEYLAQYGTPQHPSDLERHVCVNFISSKTGKYYEWDFTKDGTVLRVPMTAAIAVSDMNAYTEAALAGLGCAQLTDFSARAHLKSGRLVRVLHDWVIPPVPVHVVYPLNRHLSAKVGVFTEWLAEIGATGVAAD
ncbi:LysR family transcriptional regulator [Massilia sp. ML15P13]|uniref:LysR family transcriptional regulator n=1 Tax=Telluria aromaticivorans TaxID=2725995 RepID=A0A7Y2JUZ8_9BURK|nr:LysR family transcriptional regulator [Telluria aromaticivorans]